MGSEMDDREVGRGQAIRDRWGGGGGGGGVFFFFFFQAEDGIRDLVRSRGLGGLVIEGCVRDGDELATSGFPVFSCGRAIRGTTKVVDAAGHVGQPIVIGDITVASGDLVVGDADGVVVLARDSVQKVLAAARAREKKEASIAGALRQGRTTLEVYGWE